MSYDDVTWKVLRYYPNHEISSEGQVREIATGEILRSRKNADGHLIVKFTYMNETWQGPVWCLLIRTFYKIEIRDWRDIIVHYKDDNVRNLSVFNLYFTRTDGSAINFIRNEAGMWIRVRRNARKVRIIETGIVYNSAKEVAEELGAALNAVYMTLRGVQTTIHRVHLEYVDL